MNFQEIYDNAKNMQENVQYVAAVTQYQSILSQIQNNINLKNEFYCNLGYCAFMSKQYKLCYESTKNINNTQIMEDQLIKVISMLLLSLIFEKQYEQTLQESEKLINSSYSGRVREKLYFYRGYCLQKQGNYLLAIEEYEKSIQYGCTSYTNVAYCQFREQNYFEAMKLIDIQLNDNDDLVQYYIVKSLIYCKVYQVKQGFEDLCKAHQYFISYSYENSDYTNEELQHLNQKIGLINQQLFQSLYSVISQIENCNEPQTTVLIQFVFKVCDQTLTSISSELISQIQEVFSINLEQMKDDNRINSDLSEAPIKDYYDSFIQEAEQIYYSAQHLDQELSQVSQAKLVSIGKQIMKMIPLIGNKAQVVKQQLQNPINRQEIVKRSQAVLSLGKRCLLQTNNDEFLKELKFQLGIALFNKKYQLKITNPDQSTDFQEYLNTIKEMQDQIGVSMNFSQNINYNEENQQQLLGKKDAQELIGVYYTNGYLSSFQSQNEIHSQCIKFLVSDDIERRQLQYCVQCSLKCQHQKVEQTQAGCSDTCNIM